MKKTWFAILLCVLLLSVFVGCATEEVVPDVPQTPVVETPEEETPPAETEPEEAPETPEAVPDASEVPETELPAGSADVIGIWSSQKERMKDPALEYHNYYVCLFENGSAMRFGWRLMDLGSWTVSAGSVTAEFDRILSLGQGSGWELCEGADQVRFSYDAENNTLLQSSTTLDSEFSNFETYYPAIRTDSLEGAATRIGYYQDFETLADRLQEDYESDGGIVARLYNGLEQLAFTHAMTLVSPEEEQLWREQRAEQLDSIMESFQGGEVAQQIADQQDTLLARSRWEELILLCGPNQNKNPFYNLPESFVFAYGSDDGWYTELSIAMDGSFRGAHVFTDTKETQSFSGKFKVAEWLTRTICKLEVDTLEADQEVYGMDNAEEFLLYLPGTPVAEMSEDFLVWNWEYHLEEKETMPSGWYGLFNVGGKEGYLGRMTIDLTDGYWYRFSPQSADCYEYQFQQNGKVIMRQRDVMDLTGEYQDVLHPDMDSYEPVEMTYRVVGDQVYLGETVYQIDYETGRLITEYTESWNPGVVLPVYLEQYTGMTATLEEMILGGSRFLQWYNAKIRRVE